jgi:hypothetical protein
MKKISLKYLTVHSFTVSGRSSAPLAGTIFSEVLLVNVRKPTACNATGYYFFILPVSGSALELNHI